MYIFVILLAILTSCLWLLPKYRQSCDRNVIALKSSGAGCLGLIVLLALSGILVALLRPPEILILLVLIAFLFVPIIALLFSSFMAVKLHTWQKGTGKAPAVRAALYFLCFTLIGILIWSTGTYLKMREFQERWRMVCSGRMEGVSSISLEQRLLHPVFWKFAAQVVIVSPDGGRKTLPLPEAFNGTQLVNLYELPAGKGSSPSLILFADAFRIAAVDPVAMRVHTVRREKNAVFLDEKEITAWNLFKRAKYLGAMRGNKFVPPEMSRETPLKSMYE